MSRHLRASRIILSIFCLVLIGNLLFVSSSSAAASSMSYNGAVMIDEWAKKEYQGRQAGTPGYAKAVDDLEKRIRSAGMLPLFGEEQYRQSYSAGTAVLKKEKVVWNNKTLKLMQDYMPYARTAGGKFAFRTAYYAGAGMPADYKTKADGLVIFHWNDKNGKFPEGIQDRVQRAAANGAKAVMIVTNGELKVGNYEHPLHAGKLDIPVLYISEKAAADAGVPRNFVPAALKKSELSMELSVDRSIQQADNLAGVIPGKSEDKAILWVTNIDGFGSLPDGTWYESAKSGAASAAMMLDIARYYKKNVPEYTMIFAFVGSKWKEQEGIKALAEKLNFDLIACTIDLYAMGGNGSLDNLYVNYTDPAFKSAAESVAKSPMLNTDLGNALSSVLHTKTDKLLLIRDRNTWLDDSSADKASAIARSDYAKGVDSLLTLSGRIMKQLSEEESVPFDYSKRSVSKVAFKQPKVTLHHVQSKYYEVYADDAYIHQITPEVLKEMDSLYTRVARYNYYPLPQAKVTALFMKDGNKAAVIAGRKDLENESEKAGGGFASFTDDQMYIYMRSGPYYETIAHELNHALATANAYAGNNFELQEWQGQSHFVRYMQPKGTYTNDFGRIVKQRFLSNHEVPKLKELVANYETALDWSWYTKNAPNPDGHLYTYYVMGSMYAFLADQYGEEASRRAMYRNYIDVANIRSHLIKDTGLTLKAFLERWSGWMLRGGTASTDTSIAARKKGNNGFDYMMLYTRPDPKESEEGPNREDAGSRQTQTDGTVRYSLDIASDDLKITSLNLYKTKDGAQFEIAYESKKARFVSLFDPPNGDKIRLMKENAIAPGKGKVILKLSGAEVEVLRSLPLITVRFGDGEDFAVMENADYMKILK